ncbi:MAG: hypothetical protein KME23_12905 [Goleter apudmare HA4340-LM2]|jgi:hypothetical protein|nr:hypothetical protein [Goleter apudmare HA4340-LM2]
MVSQQPKLSCASNVSPFIATSLKLAITIPALNVTWYYICGDGIVMKVITNRFEKKVSMMIAIFPLPVRKSY